MKRTTSVASLLVIAAGVAGCMPPATYVSDVYYTDGGRLAEVRCDFDGDGRATSTCFADEGPPQSGPPTAAELSDAARAAAVPAPTRPAPTDAEIDHALASPNVHRLVELCRAQYAPEVAGLAFTLTIAPSGDLAVAPHDVTGAFAACATNALRTANLGAHDGGAVRVERQLAL